MRLRNTFNKTTSKNIRLLMRNEVNIDNKTASLQNNLQNLRIYKTKHNTVGPFLLRDRKKVSISILFEKVCLGWKLSPISNRRGLE